MKRRTGDKIPINGDYQYRALTEGTAVQRFWHHTKLLVVDRYLPLSPDEKALDVGCGSGVITSHLGRTGAEVVGVDANARAIEFAARQFGRPNVRFVLGLVDEEFRAAAQVDRIYCLEVIEHVHAAQGLRMLKVFRSLLRPGGKVLLSTPNYASLWPAIEMLMDALGLAPRLRDHQHVARYDRRTLRRLCVDAGFKVATMASCCFVAPWIAPLSWRLAEKAAGWEAAADLGLGSILVSVLEKEANGG